MTVNCVIIRKDDEIYIFKYTDDNLTNMLKQIGKYASNTDLNFNWIDAAIVSQKMHDIYTNRTGLPNRCKNRL